MTPSTFLPLNRVYLAGPDCFLADSQARYEDYSSRLTKHGFEPLVPSDGGLSLGALPSVEVAHRIFQDNLILIRSAQAVIANLSAFRGVEADSGTCFEVGMAYALGIPVFAWSTDTWWLGEELTAGLNTSEQSSRLVPYAQLLARANRLSMNPEGLSFEDAGPLRDNHGALVENMGLPFNLMLACAANSIHDGFDNALAALVEHYRPTP